MVFSLVPATRDDFFGPLVRELDGLLNEAFGRPFVEGVKVKAKFPHLDAFTEDGKLTVKLAVAGYPAENINVQVLPEGILDVTGSAKTEPKEKNYHIRELTSAAFHRQLRLPDNVTGDPSAELKDGILTLTFPLEVEVKPEPKKIEIKQ